MNDIFSVLLILVIAIIIFELSRLVVHWRKAHRLSQSTQPFSREGDSLPYSFLVLGDSTVFGTGASKPEHSLVGRIGAAFPDHSIWNRGINALSLQDLPTVIDSVSQEKSSFDRIFILIGGIDILRLTPMPTIRKNLLRSIKSAKKLSPNIYIASSSNVRSAPFFRFPADRLFEIEHRAVETLYAQVAATEEITHIPLFTEFPFCPFARNPKKLYAEDGIHPSDAGYALWFEHITPFLSKKHLSKIPKNR